MSTRISIPIEPRNSPRITPIQKAKSKALQGGHPTFKSKEKICIKIPEDMLIHGTIDVTYDGQEGILVRIEDSEAHVMVGNEIISLPTFCIAKQYDGYVL